MGTFQKAATSALAAVGLLAFAYVLYSVRALIVRVWSGRTSLGLLAGFFRIGEVLQRRRRGRLCDARDAPSYWAELTEAFRKGVRENWTKSPEREASREDLQRLVSLSRRFKKRALRAGPEPSLWRRTQGFAELDGLRDAYAEFTGGSLTPAYRIANEVLVGLKATELASRENSAFVLDRSFGDVNRIRATTLGNVVEAFDEYPVKRYWLSGAVFWPHLAQTMDDAHREALDGQRIVLDFALAVASLAVVYAVLCVFVGPWLWYRPVAWSLGATAALAGAYSFYRIGIAAARSMGETIRAAYDLHRRSLLSELGIEPKLHLHAEREQWRLLSSLAIYGDAPDFDLSEPKNPLQGLSGELHK